MGCTIHVISNDDNCRPKIAIKLCEHRIEHSKQGVDGIVTLTPLTIPLDFSTRAFLHWRHCLFWQICSPKQPFTSCSKFNSNRHAKSCRILAYSIYPPHAMFYVLLAKCPKIGMIDRFVDHLWLQCSLQVHVCRKKLSCLFCPGQFKICLLVRKGP